MRYELQNTTVEFTSESQIDLRDLECLGFMGRSLLNLR